MSAALLLFALAGAPDAGPAVSATATSALAPARPLRGVPPALPHTEPPREGLGFGPWRLPILDELQRVTREKLDPSDPDSPVARVLLGLGLGALVWLLGTWAERGRQQLGTTGLIPTVLGLLARVAGLAAAAVVVWGTVALFPKVAPEIRWGLVIGVGAVVVFAARGVLPDAFSGLVLVLERRILPGMRVEGEAFAGSVLRIGWRSTHLRGSRGLVEVPNRRLLSAPVRVTPAAEHELVLHLDPDRPVERLRRSIEDAVIASAWTAPRAGVRVHRDARDPRRWVVRVRLLEPSFAPRFDAQLPERLEAVLGLERDDLDAG